MIKAQIETRSDTTAAPRGRLRKIAIVGRMPPPPPPGGVSASIFSIVEAFRQHPDIQVIHLNWQETWKLVWLRPDIVHFNFSKPFKRFLGSVIAKCARTRIVHTIHSNEFDFTNKYNLLAIWVSDGFILLNRAIFQKFAERSTIKNLVLMTPILQSPNERCSTLELDAEAEQLLSSLNGRRIAAIYASSKNYRNGVETYGFKFIADLLPKMNEMGFSVLFLDIKGEYEFHELDPHGVGNAVHLTRGVDFKALCKRIDVYLRPTATDGNSVAILEGLEVGVPVVASDIVERPDGVILYEFANGNSFLDALKSIDAHRDPEPDKADAAGNQLSTTEDYLRFMSAV